MVAAKVLLIDDDSDFLRIYSAYLQRAGFEVATAEDGEAGLAAARQSPPDVVILDYMMTQPMEGSVVAQELREDPRLHAVPILLLTSVRAIHPWWQVRKDDKYLPVDSFLDKPISAERLVAEVNRLLGAG